MFYIKAAGGTNGAELQIYVLRADAPTGSSIGTNGAELQIYYNVQEYFMGEEQVQMEQSFKYTN